MQREKVQPSGTQLTVLRANAFHALARAYMPPDTWPEDFPEMIEAAFSPLVEAVSGARELLRVFESDTLGQEKLAPLHARLFIGPFDIQAPPWASLYLDPEKLR